jgi:DNA-binding transcriptional regulator YhcF (GntR family)
MQYFKNIPLYMQIAEQMKEEISQHTYTDKIHSESNLCKKYAVSRLTIRRALANLKEANILYSERGRGYFVVSTPEKKPLRLLVIKSNNINGHSLKKIKGIEAACRENDVRMNMFYISPDKETRDNIEILKEMSGTPKNSGIILMDYFTPDEAQAIKEYFRIPVMTLGYKTHDNISSTQYNHALAGKSSVSFFAEHGIKHSYFVAPPNLIPELEQFKLSFQHSCEEHNISVDLIPCNWSGKGIQQQMTTFLDNIKTPAGFIFLGYGIALTGHKLLQQHFDSEQILSINIGSQWESRELPDGLMMLNNFPFQSSQEACAKFIRLLKDNEQQPFHVIYNNFEITNQDSYEEAMVEVVHDF